MTPYNRAHQWVDTAHARYRERGVALVSHAPPPFRVLGKPRGPGRVLVQLQRGPVDYVGHLADGRAVRFDLKSSQNKRSVALTRALVPDHQRRELLWCHEHGGEALAAGLLLCHLPKASPSPRAWYWLPVSWLVEHKGTGDRESWGSIRWADLEDAGLRCPTMDTGHTIPDYLVTAFRAPQG